MLHFLDISTPFGAEDAKSVVRDVHRRWPDVVDVSEKGVLALALGIRETRILVVRSDVKHFLVEGCFQWNKREEQAPGDLARDVCDTIARFKATNRTPEARHHPDFPKAFASGLQRLIAEDEGYKSGIMKALANKSTDMSINDAIEAIVDQVDVSGMNEVAKEVARALAIEWFEKRNLWATDLIAEPAAEIEAGLQHDG